MACLPREGKGLRVSSIPANEKGNVLAKTKTKTKNPLGSLTFLGCFEDTTSKGNRRCKEIVEIVFYCFGKKKSCSVILEIRLISWQIFN